MALARLAGALLAVSEVGGPHRPVAVALVSSGVSAYTDLPEVLVENVSLVAGDVLAVGAPTVTELAEKLTDVAVRETVLGDHLLRVCARRPLEVRMHAKFR
jgi:hypothetical protein